MYRSPLFLMDAAVRRRLNFLKNSPLSLDLFPREVL
jgi:hypothetical protein